MGLNLSIDFETASTVDLRKTGAYAYAMHPDTRVLCMAYSFDGGPELHWHPDMPFPPEVLDHVARMRTVQGWNVGFEFLIWNCVLLRDIAAPVLSLSQLSDTMARAAYWGLPLSLDQAGAALNLPVQKDAEGHKLMMRMNKPRSYDAATGQPVWWHETDPAKYARLIDYCVQDVLVEQTIGELLPPLPDQEQIYWEMDQRMNHRGVALDAVLVDKLKELARHTKSGANAYLEQLTGGAVKTATNVGALLPYLQSIGSPLKDLTKDNVRRRVEDPSCGGAEREILEVRESGSKTSTSKLDAMLNASHQGRIRGMIQFYGAFRTGRWAGRLVQLQNLPRGSVKNIDAAIQSVLNDMSVDLLENFFGSPLGIVSSALRGCIIAAPGNKLVVADFSQIEARVVAWLAGQDDILEVFARGEDVYVYTAAQIGSTNRQLGKVLVLACGFGMSAPKFKDTAGTPAYRVPLTDLQADDAVKKWRRLNAKIVKFWYDCDGAARAVIAAAAAGNATKITVGPVQFGMWNGNMLIGLPSGRKLVYREAEIGAGRFGDSITYMGVDQYTRKWTRQHTYGGKLVENITQAVARDLMADATLRAEQAGVNVGLLVHDEMVAEVDAANADAGLASMLAIMRNPPAWAKGLPSTGAGWVGDRYKK